MADQAFFRGQSEPQSQQRQEHFNVNQTDFGKGNPTAEDPGSMPLSSPGLQNPQVYSGNYPNQPVANFTGAVYRIMPPRHGDPNCPECQPFLPHHQRFFPPGMPVSIPNHMPMRVPSPSTPTLSVLTPTSTPSPMTIPMIVKMPGLNEMGPFGMAPRGLMWTNGTGSNVVGPNGMSGLNGVGPNAIMRVNAMGHNGMMGPTAMGPSGMMGPNVPMGPYGMGTNSMEPNAVPPIGTNKSGTRPNDLRTHNGMHGRDPTNFENTNNRTGPRPAFPIPSWVSGFGVTAQWPMIPYGLPPLPPPMTGLDFQTRPGQFGFLPPTPPESPPEIPKRHPFDNCVHVTDPCGFGIVESHYYPYDKAIIEEMLRLLGIQPVYDPDIEKLHQKQLSSSDNSDDEKVESSAWKEFQLNGRETELLSDDENDREVILDVNGRPVPTPKPVTKKMRTHSNPNYCVFCRANGESKEVWSTHSAHMMGITICPVLRKYKCPICGETGDKSHTIKYCPENDGSHEGHVHIVTGRNAAGFMLNITKKKRFQKKRH